MNTAPGATMAGQGTSVGRIRTRRSRIAVEGRREGTR